MATDLATTDHDPADFWARCLTPSAKTVLDRAFEVGAMFTADEIALVEPIANAVATVRLADDRTIRQSIGSLSSVLPSKDGGEQGEKLRLNVYLTMLAGCDERALAHACRRCLEELDWLPTIHQLKERMRGWTSPEAAAISKARAIMRAPRAVVDDANASVPTTEEVERINGFLRRAGIETRFLEDGSTYNITERPEGANEPKPVEHGVELAA